jgi:hypothetical protein
VQPLNLCWAQCCRNGEWMELCTPERLVNINISETGKEVLVKEEALQSSAARRKHRLKGGGGEVCL